MKPRVRIFKKTKRYISITAIISVIILALSILIFNWSEKEIIMTFISMFFLYCSSSALTSFMYKKGILKVEKLISVSSLTRDVKRAKVLLEVGHLCSWQYSMKAGILKFDNPGNSLLGHSKAYYTHEELMRNKDIRRIMHTIEDRGNQYIDDEVYFPIIKKWVIVRGQEIDMEEDGEPNQFIGIIIDNTERREIYKQLEILSVTDELTNLKNRRFFFDTLKKDLSQFNRDGKIFSVAMMDLDHFKNINDSYGHPAGDFILKSFSEQLVKEVRPYDLVARIGGEEFIILFPGIDKDEAENIINRIKDKVKKSSTVFDSIPINYTFSCGLADATELNLCTEDEFITIIDSRLYKAKNSGRNLIVTRS